MKKLLVIGVLLFTVCGGVAIAGCPLGPLPAGWSMISNPCDSGVEPLSEFLPVAPEGTMLYKYDEVAGGYEFATYAGGAWEGDLGMTLSPGEGLWVDLPEPAVLVFEGMALIGAEAIPLPAGYSIRSAPAGLGMTGFPAADGDSIYIYVPAAGGYDFYDYFGGIWFPADPPIGVGEAFWVFKTEPAVWAQ